MVHRLQQLTKHSLIYGLGGTLNRLIGFFLLPIYTRYLTPTDYGILSLLGVTSSIATTIAMLGLGTAMFREVIFEGSDERAVESTTLYFLAGESILIFGVLIWVSPLLSEWIFRTPQYAQLMRLIFVTDFLSVADIVLMARLRSRAQSSLYSLLSVSRFLVGIVLNLYFIVVLGRGVEGLITAGLIAAALFAAVSLILLSGDLRLTFSLAILRRMLSFGVPLVPVGLSSLFLTLADRYFLQHFATTTEVGLYSLGYNIGMVMRLAEQSFQLAWPPYCFSVAKQSDAEHQFARILSYCLIIFGFLGLGLSVLAREVLVIMTTPKFYSAYKVVPLIALSYIFSSARHVTNSGLATQNKMKYTPPIIIGSGLFNLGLNYLLIPPYGMMGAAWATVISYFTMVVVTTVVNQHFWYIHYEYHRMVKIALVCAVIYCTNLLIQTSNLWLNMGVKLVLLASYPFLLYVFRVYEKEELTMVKRLFRFRWDSVRARRVSS
jgi:O-antigen/teichoic acid export membrane protein